MNRYQTDAARNTISGRYSLSITIQKVFYLD